MEINREDMLELTRRMTPKRNCFSRIAGAYFDEDGFIDGTFNRHFLKLSQKDIETNLYLAKTVPFSETNKNLIYHPYSTEDKKTGHIWQMLMGLRDCGLKNDALLDLFYDFIGKKYISEKPYAVRMLHSSGTLLHSGVTVLHCGVTVLHCGVTVLHSVVTVHR